jgi:DNA invertase Pin-like site-specific DNA recombinase
VGSNVESAGVSVRVVGYVREAPSLTEGETAFAQSERIRRWAADSGHHLIATCQDGRDPSQPLNRDGYRALLDIVRSGSADALVVSDLSVLSPDKVTQEIMLDHLRELGLTIVSASESDHNDLLDEPDDHTRLVVRDVIAKVGAFRREFADPEPAFDKDIAPVSEPVGADVIVQLMPQGSQLDDSAAHTARPTA